MPDWRVRSGALLGLVATIAFIAAQSRSEMSSSRGEHGPLLSDCDGAIRELVVHYVPEAATIVETAYRQFLRQLPEDINVYVVCPDQAAFKDFCERVLPVTCRLLPVRTGHAMTCWSRDRWLAMAPGSSGRKGLLLSPREEAGADVWAQRKGDQRIGNDLARALPAKVVSQRSDLAFDGGDFVVDAYAVFVTPRVLQRNLGSNVHSAEQLRHRLATIFQRKIILLSEAPEHHAGMFMMLAGNRTAVVGDPSLAEEMFSQPREKSVPFVNTDSPRSFSNPDFSEATQKKFDAVAARCASAGYRVIRMPVVPDRDGRTYLTYLNVIIDQRGKNQTVYLPVYRNAETLNRAAGKIWQNLGYQVRPVDCTETYTHFGSLRCLVNVLSRANPE